MLPAMAAFLLPLATAIVGASVVGGDPVRQWLGAVGGLILGGLAALATRGLFRAPEEIK